MLTFYPHRKDLVMGLSAISNGFQPLQASLQPAKTAQQAAPAPVQVSSGDGDGDADDHGGVSTASDRLLDITA